MAYSATSLTAAETAALAKDKPIILSPNRIPAAATIQWRTSGSWASGTNGTAAAGPTTYLGDDFSHLKTLPSSAQTTWYLLFDFGAAGIQFDTIAILSHTFVATTTLVARVSDLNDYTTGHVPISTTAFVAGRRMVVPLTNRFSVARYVRLDFASSGGSITPQIGEVIFGNRVQLDWRPDVSYDPSGLHTPNVRSSETLTSIKRSVALGNKNRRRLNATSIIDSAAVQANLLAWFAEHGGTRPFLWIDNPNTAPHKAMWAKLNEPSFDFPYVDALNRQLTLEAEEQGPSFTALEP